MFHDPNHQFNFTRVPSVFLPTQINASKSDFNVSDLRSPEIPNTKPGFWFAMTGHTTGDANSYIRMELWEAKGKDSGTALQATTERIVGGLGNMETTHDVLGTTENDVLLHTDADLVVHPELPFIRLAFAAQVGKVYYFAYRGNYPVLQLQAVEVGTADVEVMGGILLYSAATVNVKPPIVNYVPTDND